MGAQQINQISDDSQLSLFPLENCGAEEKIPRLDRSFEVIGGELLTENLDPECWARALVETGGTEAEALSRYAQLRAESLSETVEWKQEKAKALEDRKIAAAQESTKRSIRRVFSKDTSLVWDFLFWQALLSLSGVGLYLTILAMGGQPSWWPGWIAVITVSACLQASPILLYGFGRFLFGSFRYQQALGLTAILVIGMGSLFAMGMFQGKKLPKVSLLERQPAAVQGSPATGYEEF